MGGGGTFASVSLVELDVVDVRVVNVVAVVLGGGRGRVVVVVGPVVVVELSLVVEVLVTVAKVVGGSDFVDVVDSAGNLTTPPADVGRRTEAVITECVGRMA